MRARSAGPVVVLCLLLLAWPGVLATASADVEGAGDLALVCPELELHVSASGDPGDWQQTTCRLTNPTGTAETIGLAIPDARVTYVGPGSVVLEAGAATDVVLGLHLADSNQTGSLTVALEATVVRIDGSIVANGTVREQVFVVSVHVAPPVELEAADDADRRWSVDGARLGWMLTSQSSASHEVLLSIAEATALDALGFQLELTHERVLLAANASLVVDVHVDGSAAFSSLQDLTLTLEVRSAAAGSNSTLLASLPRTLVWDAGRAAVAAHLSCDTEAVLLEPTLARLDQQAITCTVNHSGQQNLTVAVSRSGAFIPSTVETVMVPRAGSAQFTFNATATAGADATIGTIRIECEITHVDGAPVSEWTPAHTMVRFLIAETAAVSGVHVAPVISEVVMDGDEQVIEFNVTNTGSERTLIELNVSGDAAELGVSLPGSAIWLEAGQTTQVEVTVLSRHVDLEGHVVTLNATSATRNRSDDSRATHGATVTFVEPAPESDRGAWIREATTFGLLCCGLLIVAGVLFVISIVGQARREAALAEQTAQSTAENTDP